MISKTELEKMNRDYSNLLQEHGDDEKSLGWNKPKQQFRFEIFLNMISRQSDIFHDTSLRLLDVGCGLGHFYEFLMKKNIGIDYLGVDINPDFIDLCKAKYTNAMFYNELAEENFHDCDIICASGIFNRYFDKSLENIQEFITNTQKTSAKIIVVNFLHTGALLKHDDNFYTSIADIESVIDRKLTNGFYVDAASLPGRIYHRSF